MVGIFCVETTFFIDNRCDALRLPAVVRGKKLRRITSYVSMQHPNESSTPYKCLIYTMRNEAGTAISAASENKDVNTDLLDSVQTADCFKLLARFSFLSGTNSFDNVKYQFNYRNETNRNLYLAGLYKPRFLDIDVCQLQLLR